MRIFDFYKKKMGNKSDPWLTESTVKPMECEERIVIRHALYPDHAGECTFGYSLVFVKGEWLFETTRIIATGVAKKEYSYKRLRNNFWKGNIYRTLNNHAVGCFEPITPANCEEREKLEHLVVRLSNQGKR